MWIKHGASNLIQTDYVPRLVIRPGGIGDVIVSLPALQLLAGPGDEVWTPARTVPLIRFAPTRAISDTGLDLLGVTDPPPNLVERLRRFDSIVSWYGANRVEFRDAVAALGLPFTFLPPARRWDDSCHGLLFAPGAAAGPERRHRSGPAHCLRCPARPLCGHSPLLRKFPEELAA